MNDINSSLSKLMATPTKLPLLPEIIPILGLVAAVVIDLSSKRKKTIFLYKISASAMLVSASILLWQWVSFPASERSCNNEFGNLFRFFLLICSFLSVSSSVDYILCSKMPLAEFLLLQLSAGLGGMVLSCANDLVTIYVSLEFIALSSCFLSGYTKRDMRSNEASTKFLLMSGASSSPLLYGFSSLYAPSGGRLQLDETVDGILFNQYRSIIYISTAFITAGTLFKLSLPPFHQWTPDVYEGSPTPVVALFSVTSKVAALVSFTRLFGLIFPDLSNEWHGAVGLLATFSMILGNLIAVTQRSVKRMLAYPSISQIGYIMIGILSADSENGYASMITYTFIYILMNLGAFACITLFGLRTGTDNIRDYVGLYMKDPVLTFSSILRSLSLGGMPPLSGFFGKLHLFWHGWKAGSYPLVLVALVTSVISIYYYLKIIKSMFTEKSENNNTPIIFRQNSLVYPSVLISKNSLEIVMIICALTSTLLGIFIDPIIEITRNTFF
uniref:NADH dehydrogenase subunit 2 n=1 Tax=Adiantum malesianum TaxID=451080 RepID=UPI00201E39D3|nr:NADH dehydrogenase subunit 2 [Adiantum malesianum]UPV69498.1 NADH dehydrogenase subunit 2 [Adiantum malesianum]